MAQRIYFFASLPLKLILLSRCTTNIVLNRYAKKVSADLQIEDCQQLILEVPWWLVAGRDNHATALTSMP